MPCGWYELERYTKGRWVLDAMFDDKEIAISEAERLLEGRRAVGVRVRWTDDSGRPPHTVFRKSSVDEANREALKQRTVVQQQALAARGKRRQRAIAQSRQPKSSGPAIMRHASRVAVLVAVCATIIGAVWYVSRGIAQVSPIPGADYPTERETGGSGPTIHWGGR